MADLLTLNQVADLTGIKAKTLRQQINRGQIPEAVKLGRDWLIPAPVARSLKPRKPGRPK